MLRLSPPHRLFFWLMIAACLLLALFQVLPASLAGTIPGDLVISEFLAANRAGLADEDGETVDWIEIYNPGNRPVNLAGWSLTDDPEQPQKWTFPGIVLGSQQYLLVFASGKDRRPGQPGAPLHANFKLKQEGEFLGLYNIFYNKFTGGPGQNFPEQFDDVAYGRYTHPAAEPAYGYLTRPTPGYPNDEGSVLAGVVAPVAFSAERGFYRTSFTVNLTTATPGATIRYTLDGSPPTESHGAIYTTPLTVQGTTLLRAGAFKPKFRPSPVETHSYLFLDNILSQSNRPPGFPRTWGGYEGVPVMADYEVDLRIVSDPRYRETITDSLLALPTLSITMDIQSFHDLYANPRRKGRAWERPVSVELFDPQHRQPGFQINAGLRTHGELGRAENIPKHPFRLFFRSEYGASKLQYPLFPGSPVKEFNTLVLRSGVNRSYAGYPKREDDIRLTAYTRDEWLRASQVALSGFGARGLFVHLYLNGLYWGLYNLVERPDEALMSAYFGGSEENWQVVDHDDTSNTAGERFNALHQLVRQARLEDPDKYAAIQTYLDVPHFIDYLILNWYSGNLDWGFNNWFAGVPNPSGPIRYFVWDGERTWYEGAEIYMELDEYRDRPNLVRPLFEALLANPEFRIELADRLYRHLYQGELTDARAQARWLSLNHQIEQAMISESARWGDTRFERPLTQEDWFKARDDVLAQMDGNAARLIALARTAGYYPPLDPPIFNQSGGRIEPGFRLTMSLPDVPSTPGKPVIYYTTDGSDPRSAVTGAVAPGASVYQAPLVLTGATTLKARAWSENGGAGSEPTWSALNEASFHLAEPARGIAITEIMYNPPDGHEYEFIELQNVGEDLLSMAGAYFDQGISYTFPAGPAPLAPGETIVLVRNPTAFAQRYPGIKIGGVYEGKLANEGERVTLRDATGQVWISMRYDDENGWPLSPDGQGDSLVLINAGGDPDDPQNWRASTTPNGSPGTENIAPY